MADLTEAYTALQKADAAGDAEGAKQLADYIRSQNAPQTPVAAATQPEGNTWLDALKNVGSAAVRPVVKAVSGLATSPLDAGVAAGNLITNLRQGVTPTLADFNPFARTGGTPQEVPFPSSIVNTALDRYTRAPTGIVGKGSEFVNTVLAGSQLPVGQLVKKPAPEGVDPSNANLRNAILQKSQDEGYVVPPSANNPTMMNRLLEGLAGKAKTTQEALLRNQRVTDRLSATGIGQSAEAPLVSESMAAIRAEADAAGYAPVRAAGEMQTDRQFLKSLQDLTKAGRGAARMGLDTTSPITKVVEPLAQIGKFDAGDGLDSVSYLRSLADDAYSSGQGTLGAQYKAASKAIEDVIERNLTSRGTEGSRMLDAFRNARQLMAQTYTAGKAMIGDSGNFNARVYATELARGKPLIGDQRTIADFATSFKDFAKPPTGVYPTISPLDVTGSVIAAGATHSVAPLAYPLTRLALRDYLLSPAGQARAIQSAADTPENLGVLASGFAGLWSQSVQGGVNDQR